MLPIQTINPEKDVKTFSFLLPWFFFAAAFESLFAAAALLWIPSENGLSAARLVLFGILVIFFVMGLALGFFARRPSFRFEHYTAALIFSALLFLAASLTLFLLRYLDPQRMLPYYERVSPLLWYLLALGFQSSLLSLLLRNGLHPQEFFKRKPVYLSALFAFCVLFLIFLFVAITKIGVTRDTAYWGEPGIAILGWQFILSILVGFALLLYAVNARSLPGVLSRFLIPFALYLTAVILWLGVPVSVLQNSFYAPITPPTNLPLPYSDAGFYDYLSQTLLIGTGYLNSIPPRPLYVTFLAFLHFLFGQNYPAIIAAQTCVLALFPVALYFLGKKLHTPAAGVTVALFAIFRELTGLWLSSTVRVANSKIFTTDFPTALSLVFLSLVFLWWLEKRDLKSTLLTGGFFGLVLLFRTQSLIVLPVVFILAWFAYQRKTKDWIVAGVIFVIPMVLTVIPWLTHNYALTGKFTFDDPRQVAVIYSQYGFTGNNDLSLYNHETDKISEKIISFTRENPAYVATFLAAHFLNTEIGGLLSLPLIERFDGLFAPVNPYWVAWDGTITWYNLALLILYLVVIAVGLGAAWRRARWLGLIPLAVNIGYALSNAVSRFSSWRYNMPIDWVVYFYFAIGIMEILGGALLLFGAKHEKTFSPNCESETKPISPRDFRPRYILFIALFMFVGATPWLAKGFAAPRYTSTQEQLIERVGSYAADDVRVFLDQPNALIVEGVMMYPRMYRRDEGMSSAHPWSAYKVRGYPRLTFLLLNSQRYDMVFPTKDLLDFPQGVDVTALACKMEDHYEVRAILFNGQFFQSAPLPNPCKP